MLNKRLVQLFKLVVVLNLSLFFCAYVQILDLKEDYSLFRTSGNQFAAHLKKELVDMANKSENWTVGSVFDVLNAHKAFLIDVDHLSQSKIIKKLVNLNFGIFFKNFFSLVKNLENIQCRNNVSYVKYENLTIPSAVYANCDGSLVQVSAFYQRANFFWIPGDDYKIEPKFFNDKNRAISRFKITKHHIQNTSILVPLDVKKFLKDYKNSEFLECSYSLAEYNYKHGYSQDIKKSVMFSQKLSYIAEMLELTGVDYWLAGGTLLGWYRDCGFIPHTTDLDIGLLYHQYDPRVKHSFLGNKKAALIVEFGYPNDSYELRLDSDGLQIDMFYFYDFNSTHHWCGYQEKRIKKRRFLTKSDLCSAELLGRKYLIPCKVETYLNEEYGNNLWKIPKKNNYVWSNLIYWKNWTESEWKTAIKFYGLDGTFLQKETLDYIKMYK